jgi:hypothetical protein
MPNSRQFTARYNSVIIDPPTLKRPPTQACHQGTVTTFAPFELGSSLNERRGRVVDLAYDYTAESTAAAGHAERLGLSALLD